MPATIIEIADALNAAIVAARDDSPSAFSHHFTCKRRLSVSREMSKVDSLAVFVVPRTTEPTQISRGGYDDRHTLAVVIQRRVRFNNDDDPVEIDLEEAAELTQEIADWARKTIRLVTVNSSEIPIVSDAVSVDYFSELMDTHQTWAAVVAVPFDYRNN